MHEVEVGVHRHITISWWVCVVLFVLVVATEEDGMSG